MSKQNTTTRTGDKVSPAGSGASDEQPSAQQPKANPGDTESAMDPENPTGDNSSATPTPETSGGDLEGSGAENPGGETKSDEGEPLDPSATEPIGDNAPNKEPEQFAPKSVLPVIAVAHDGTEELVRHLWEKFLPEGVPVSVGIEAPLEEMLSYIIASPAVPDEFIFVPANCVPVTPVDPADLSQIKVYVRKDSTRSFDEPLPMLLNKDQLIESLAAEPGLAAEGFFERYAKTHHAGIRPMEVSHDFGNFITLVMRSNPCENVVIGGMCQRKFIAASAEGWKAIEHLLNKRLE